MHGIILKRGEGHDVSAIFRARKMKRIVLPLIVIFFSSLPAVFGQPQPEKGFLEIVESRLASDPTRSSPTSDAPSRFSAVCPAEGSVTLSHILREYGAVYAASSSVTAPTRCMYRSESEVREFQSQLRTRASIIGGTSIELQDAAMAALMNAAAEARAKGLSITPLDGAIAGKRTFADTVRIWNSRFLPALAYYVWTGGITMTEAEAVRWWEFEKQAEKVLEWESRGYYFGTGRRGPIFASTAPPGTSQHLSLLAFDVVQYGNPGVRKILNKYGWFQTVVNDGPHFTFLGLSEAELPNRGLKAVSRGGIIYWVPDLGSWPAPPRK
jgi:hypothetical protein